MAIIMGKPKPPFLMMAPKGAPIKNKDQTCYRKSNSFMVFNIKNN